MSKVKSPLQENKMGVMPVGKLLFNMALPMIISMLVQALYNVVDSMYVYRLSDTAGDALGLAFPLQNIQIGVATGIGVGVNSLLSKSLGEGDQDRANRAAGNGITMVSIAYVAFLLFGIFGSRSFFAVQKGVTQELVDSGTTYITICFVLTIGVFMSVLAERMLQSTGRTVLSMITQGVGAITNIILDPVFIFGFGPVPAMGIAGAAIATVIGQFASATVGIILNVKYNPDVQLRFAYLKLRKDIVLPILNVGIPSIVMVAVGSVMNFAMNQILLGFSKAAAGVFGIYYKLQSFFFMPLFGLNNATISILAYNYGAQKPDRLMKTLKVAALSAVCIMLAGFAAFQLIPELLLSIFTDTPEYHHIGAAALRGISCSFPLAAICIAVGASFQALGKGIYSTITSLCRQMVVLLPAAYLLSLTGEVNAVWWSFPIAEIMSLLVTAICFARIYKRQIKPLYK